MRMTNTGFIGKVYHRFDQLASTNDYAAELLAKSKPPEGTVVQAASQSAGRGQYGSHWHSAPGQNLTLSVIFYPSWLPIDAQFRLNEAVALAVFDTLDSLPGRPQTALLRIKWPNDIWLGPLKTAGILLQNSLKGRSLDSTIAGIGLNVNQLEFPPEAPRAISLAQEWGHTFDLDALAHQLFACLERRYLQLKSGQTDALRADYHQRLLGWKTTRSFRRPDGSVFSGEIQGVAEDGQLMVQTARGTEMFGLKEIQFLT